MRLEVKLTVYSQRGHDLVLFTRYDTHRFRDESNARPSSQTNSSLIPLQHLCAVALRAVTTTDFMTAESYNVPWDVLGTVTSRIVNEVKHVNRVFYDCTGKPPATIEME